MFNEGTISRAHQDSTNKDANICSFEPDSDEQAIVPFLYCITA